MNGDHFEAGRHSAQIEALDSRCDRIEKTVEAVARNVETLVYAAAERRGERKIIALVATMMGGIGSFLMTLLLKLWGPE